jgi:hypothetical protein
LLAESPLAVRVSEAKRSAQLFFERVNLDPGDDVGRIFDLYGIDRSRLADVLQNAPNQSLPANASLLSQPPQVTSICVPIDNYMTVVNSRTVIDLQNGLRPLDLSLSAAERAARIARATHGVEILAERDGNACARIRWLQTVKSRNRTDLLSGRPQPPEFVDGGGNNLPFYIATKVGSDDPDDTTFQDTPCCGVPKRPGQEPEFSAVLSLVVWTHPRITIIDSWAYAFRVNTNGHIHFDRPRDATSPDIAEQIRILKAGRSQFGTDTGPSLDYRPTPPHRSVNI